MRHDWKGIRHRLSQAVTLLALFVVVRGVGYAQSLAFSPGLTSVAAGDPTPSNPIASPATYVGPASGLVAASGGYFDAVTDRYGNVYISEYAGNIVRVIASGKGPIPTLPNVSPQAGYAYTVLGTGVDSGGNPLGVSSSCSNPIDADGDGCLATQSIIGGVGGGYALGIAVDSNGNLYIADYLSDTIRVVYGGQGTIPSLTQPQTGYVYQIAGTFGQGNSTGDGGLATAAQIGNPEYIAVDTNGNIYFVDTTNNVLSAIFVNGAEGLPGFPNAQVGDIYTIAGKGTKVTNGGPASSSAFSAAGGIAIDSSGNVYVADTSTIRVIYVGGSVAGLTNLASGDIYAVAGGGTTVPSFFTATPATSARMSPVGIGFDQAGNIYVASGAASDYIVDKVDPSGNVTRIYGLNSGGTVYTCPSPVDQDDDGCASDIVSGDFIPQAVALDAEGNLYVPSSQSLVLVLHKSTVTTSSLYFTSGQTQPVIIYNTGSATSPALTLTSFTASSGFTVVPLSPVPTGFAADCSTLPTLSPGESCEAQIEFPSGYTGAGNATGTLTVASNSTNAANGTNVILLTGESSTLGATLLTLKTALPNSITAGTEENIGFSLGCNNSCNTSSTAFPTGTLTLYDNGSPLTSVSPLTASNTGTSTTYTFNNVTLPTGSNLIYAVYSGDTNYAGSQSYQASVAVSGTATTTSVQASPTTAATNSTVTLTATVGLPTGVTASTGESAPTGTVTFFSGGTSLGPGPLSNGSASITTQFASAGTDSITAVYVGDDYYNTSTSASVTVTVSAPVTTSTVVSASLVSIGDGSSTTLSAAVMATSGTTAPAGSVQFYYTPSGGTTATAIGGSIALTPGTSGASAAAQLATMQLPEGKDSITAVYTPSSSLFTATPSNAVIVTVGAPSTTTTLTSPPTSITYGQSVTLSAQVTATVGNTVPTGSVDFTVGSTDLGSVSLNGSGVASLTTSAFPGGSGTVTDQLIATYGGSTTFASSVSITASVSVTPVGTTTGTPTSSNLNPVSGQTLTLTASVSATGSSIQPTGTVTFYSGGSTSLCSVVLSNGVASCPTSLLPQGTDSVTAVYVGGNGFTTSTSNPLSLTVAPPSATTMTSLAASTNSLYTGQGVTFTATVKDTSGAAIPTGVVVFQNGTNQLGPGNLNGSGVATFTLTPSAAATYNVTAVYQGNSSFTGSTSSPAVTVLVSTALTQSTTSLNVSSTAVQQGANVTFTATVASASTSAGITPTGTVTFYNGTNSLGTGNLNGGTATYSTTALGAGSYSVTAQYSGDSNFSGSTSSAVALTVDAPTPSFSLTATPANLTIQSGQTAQAIITLAPTYAYTGTVTLACGTLPANVTCSFSPATLTADGKNDAVQSTLTISTTGAGSATAASIEGGEGAAGGQIRRLLAGQTRRLGWPRSSRGGDGALAKFVASVWPLSSREGNGSVRALAVVFLPGCLLLCGFARRRKRLGRYLPLLMLGLLTAGLAGLSGCGGGNGGSSTDAAAGTSQITISAAGSAGSQNQTVNLSLTVTQ